MPETIRFDLHSMQCQPEQERLLGGTVVLHTWHTVILILHTLGKYYVTQHSGMPEKIGCANSSVEGACR